MQARQAGICAQRHKPSSRTKCVKVVEGKVACVRRKTAGGRAECACARARKRVKAHVCRGGEAAVEDERAAAVCM